MQAAQQAQQVAAGSSPASGLKPIAERERSVSLSQQHVNGMPSAAPPERQEPGLSQQQPGPAMLGAKQAFALSLWHMPFGMEHINAVAGPCAQRRAPSADLAA